MENVPMTLENEGSNLKALVKGGSESGAWEMGITKRNGCERK